MGSCVLYCPFKDTYVEAVLKACIVPLGQRTDLFPDLEEDDNAMF